LLPYVDDRISHLVILAVRINSGRYLTFTDWEPWFESLFLASVEIGCVLRVWHAFVVFMGVSVLAPTASQYGNCLVRQDWTLRFLSVGFRLC
jgi:hypothetical protein